MSEYYEKLHALWVELDHLRHIKNESVWEYTNKDRLFKFLLSLKFKYNTLRSQILNWEKIPNLEEAYYIVLDEESRKSLTFEGRSKEGVSLLAKSKGYKDRAQKNTKGRDYKKN